MHFSDLGLEATHASGKIRDDLHKVTNVISKAHDDGSNISKTGVVWINDLRGGSEAGDPGGGGWGSWARPLLRLGSLGNREGKFLKVEKVYGIWKIKDMMTMNGGRVIVMKENIWTKRELGKVNKG